MTVLKMPKIKTSACLVYTQKQMYDLVNDAESYPHFLPLCSQAGIISRTATTQMATITLSKGKVELTFTTSNTMEENRRIDMTLVEGPFRYLQATWLFRANQHAGCDVSFELDFEFSSSLMRLVFGSLFNKLSVSMVDVFRAEAALRYGKTAQQ